jgi:hypothetical protein
MLHKAYRKNLECPDVNKLQKIWRWTCLLQTKVLQRTLMKGESPAYPFKNVRMVLIPQIRNIHAKNACHQ